MTNRINYYSGRNLNQGESRSYNEGFYSLKRETDGSLTFGVCKEDNRYIFRFDETTLPSIIQSMDKLARDSTTNFGEEYIEKLLEFCWMLKGREVNK